MNPAPKLIVTDPATDEVVGEVDNQGADETRQAVEAAQAALPAWRTRTARDRGALLHELSRRMLSDSERLAVLMTREQGKPLAESRGEIAYAASFLEWAAAEGRRLYGDLIPGARADQRILVLRQPIGVCAAITPWNFPSAMITRKLGPALASGCTMVVKPAEQTPLSALALAQLCREVGIPDGVVQVVTGDPAPIGDALLAHPAVRMLSFTGSTEVGRLLLAKSAQHITRMALELGGHAPFLVFDDADLDLAVAAAVACKYRNAGQTCICANRFLVQDGIYEEFAGRLVAAVQHLRVGPGLHEGVAIGPLIDDAAVEKVLGHVDDARTRGARLLVGGALVDAGPGLTRRFYAPTVLDGVTGAMRCSTEETFGPVAPLRRFTHEEEAIAIANDTMYGLAAYFFTRDAGRVMRVAEALEYGIVGVNDGGPSAAEAPFGGTKHSGLGREGGRYAMDEFTELKYVSWRV